MEFLVQVLRVNNRKSLPADLRKELLANAKYIRRFDVWLFEGDWETALGEWIDAGIKIKCVGEVIVESTHGHEKKLYPILEDMLEPTKY